jgi:hypothetical protein
MSRTPTQLLLQLRSLHEQLAQRRMVHARGAQLEAEHAAARTAHRIATATMPDRATPGEFMATAAARQALVGLMLTQRQEVEVAALATAEATAAWSVTERDREAVDRLVRREKDERRAGQLRDEQRESDDLATARHDPARDTHDTEGGDR